MRSRHRAFAPSLATTVLVAAALLPWASSRAQPVQRLRVAVVDLSGSALKMQATTVPAGQPQPPVGQQTGSHTTVTIAIPPPAEFARGLTEILTSVLVKTGRFSVLERSALAQLSAEHALAAHTTKETAVQAGALLGAQALIVGDVTGFTYHKSSLGGTLTNVVKGLSVAGERVTAEVTLDLRLVDAATGEVIHSAKGSGRAAQTGVAADLVKEDKRYGTDFQTSTPLGQASRAAIQNAVVALAVGMPPIRWSGRVVDVREGVVYVNAAELDGMKPGLELEVYVAEPPLVDPSTGKSLGAPERLIGTIVIDRVLEKFSTARVTKGEGLARGHVVRLKSL